jgi:acyl carrier protein phosphodiesterase
MISDYVKGKTKFDYPADIQQGIILHRYIDQFTDAHPATKEAIQLFRPQYRLYAGAFVDVVYDHFLANDPSIFGDAAQLKVFANNTYAILQAYTGMLPDRFVSMLPYMVQQDWLSNYRHRQGIEKSMGGVVRRSAYLTESAIAFALFEQHYSVLEDCYRCFFPDLLRFTNQQLERGSNP